MEEPPVEDNVLELILAGSKKPADLPLPLLQDITKQFSEERIIGEGGFGTVYKGVLRNGEVAVKRIRNSQTIEEKLFRREVTSLLNVNHKNIVRFLGFCSNTEHKAIQYGEPGEYVYAEHRERLMCFEYINNRSLDKYIADELRGPGWSTRYKIIKGICEGLEYLHTKKQMVHMDLKPANILIDDDMSAKITDFGLSRMVENLETNTSKRFASLGYTAPEYLEGGKMSVKSDVYSLGVIIIELVTGRRGIPDNDKNVLRRWRHRWHKSGKETPFVYQQITKLIEIGLRCHEKDPYKRPSISDIIRDINELENIDTQFSNANNSTVRQISPYSEDDMLGVEPLELCFPFKPNKQISCILELTNETNAYIAFIIQTSSPVLYYTQPGKGITQPQSKRSVNITLLPLDKAPQDRQYTGDFIVRSTRVDGSPKDEDITEDIFNKEKGNVVDEVTLTVAYESKVPKVDLSLESLTISGTGNLSSPEESNVRPAEAESTISLSKVDDLIQFDPPELRFPLLPNKKVVSSVKVMNITDLYVGFNVCQSATSVANYETTPTRGILPPRSTQVLTVQREVMSNALQDNQFNDKYFLWTGVVVEGITDVDLDGYVDDEECKELPIVLTDISPCTSNDLIQFDPPDLSFPLLPNKASVTTVNVINVTDCFVRFNVWFLEKNAAWYYTEPGNGILPPRSTQRMVVKRTLKENAFEDMQRKENFFVWNMIVAEGVEASNLNDYMDSKDSKDLPIILKEISPCTTADLIRFDPPELCFTFLQNKTLLSSVNIVNITDYYIGFNFHLPRKISAWYSREKGRGILPPRSNQRLVIRRVLKDMHCEDKFFVWNGVVSEGVEASDLTNYATLQESMEMPIILNRISSSTSNELIQIEPPMLCFPFLPNKSLYASIKIANITDYFVGFNTCENKTNVALYKTEPPCGILPPRSMQELVVTRVANQEAPEDTQCKDNYFVWSTFVTEGVEVSDLPEYLDAEESTKLPIVFTVTNSNELIQFDPPKLLFPTCPNKSVLTSINIVNITDQLIGFNICTKKSNSARYCTNPSEGILPPHSTQVLVVTRIAEQKELEDTQCEDKYLVWNGIVTEGTKDSDVVDNMSETKITELPIVLTKRTSPALDELIQFDPPKLCFPLLPNKKVLSSINIVNVTDYNIGFITYSGPKNGAWFHTEPPRGILPPGSTQNLMVTREQKEDALEDMEFNDKYFVWNSIVSEGVKESELGDYMADQESKELPIVLNKISSLTSADLIQLDPAEIRFPILHSFLYKVNIVNITDFYVAFNAYDLSRNAAQHRKVFRVGILPPRSTEKVEIIWTPSETELENMERDYDTFVWNRVVSEGVKAEDFIGYMDEEESKELLYIIDKTSPCASEELIQFDPPELSFPFLPNKPSVSSVNIVNCTDYHVAFRGCQRRSNVARYLARPREGIMPPRSTQRLAFRIKSMEEEVGDVQCEDKMFLWNRIATEGVEASDIIGQMDGKLTLISKALPIVLQKTSLSISDELIQFEPPQLQFSFFPNKRAPMVSLVKIVNVTDHHVGFVSWFYGDNSAMYSTDPYKGILPPRATQAIKVRRLANEKEPENMQCKDKAFIWNCLVTEGFEVGDLIGSLKEEESKQLPIVLTKTNLCSSEELIQFDPPQLSFPFLPNKRVSVVCSVNIVNVTDHCIGFKTWSPGDNSVSYHTNPNCGILPPRSTQALRVKMVANVEERQEVQYKDNFFVWNSIVTDGVQISDLIYFDEEESKEFPVILAKTSSCTSNELIQFDPPELRFPFVPNKRVPMLCLVKIVNVTDRSIGFNTWVHDNNSALYQMDPDAGILSPQSSQVIKVKRTPRQKEPEDMRCKDMVGVLSGIVTEGVEIGHISWNEYQDKELPIVFSLPNPAKTSKCSNN